MSIGTEHATLVIVRGVPGSGKSYIATELQKVIGEEKVVLLDPDAIDYDSQTYRSHCREQAKEGVDPALYAYRFLRAQAYRAIEQRKVIVWNQPFTNKEIFHKMIGRLQDHAKEWGTEVDVLIVEVSIDEAVARARVQQRKRDGGHGPSEQTLSKRIEDYDSFAGEGFPVLAVDGEQEVSKSVAVVIAALRDGLNRI